MIGKADLRTEIEAELVELVAGRVDTVRGCADRIIRLLRDYDLRQLVDDLGYYVTDRDTFDGDEVLMVWRMPGEEGEP